MFAQIVYRIFDLISILLVLRAILSWFPGTQQNKLYEILYMVTEPFLMPFRALFNKLMGQRGFFIDLSYIAAFVTINIIRSILILAM